MENEPIKGDEMSYILVIILSSWQSTHTVSMNSFKTMNACQKVLEETVSLLAQERSYPVQAKCIEVKE